MKYEYAKGAYGTGIQRDRFILSNKYAYPMAKKQDHGRLTDKGAFVAVAISLSAVTIFIKLGVVF